MGIVVIVWYVRLVLTLVSIKVIRSVWSSWSSRLRRSNWSASSQSISSIIVQITFVILNVLSVFSNFVALQGIFALIVLINCFYNSIWIKNTWFNLIYWLTSVSSSKLFIFNVTIGSTVPIIGASRLMAWACSGRRGIGITNSVSGNTGNSKISLNGHMVGFGGLVILTAAWINSLILNVWLSILMVWWVSLFIAVLIHHSWLTVTAN